MEKYFVIDCSDYTAMGIGNTIDNAVADLAMQTGLDYCDISFNDLTVIKGKEIMVKRVVQFLET